MSANGIRLANENRLASEQRSRTIGGIAHTVDYQEVAIAHVGQQPLPFSRYLKDAANSDSIDMLVDGTTPVNFDLVPASGELLRLEKLVLLLALTSEPRMDEFGDQTALGNGLSLDILDNDDAVIFDFLDGVPIQSNNDFLAIDDFRVHGCANTYSIRVLIVPASPIRLEETATGEFEKLRLTVSDNLSASSITAMHMMAHGRLESTLT